MKKPNIVCIGGGTGQSEILRGLKEFDCNITAIVAVTDSGRSTGVIRSNFDMPAPGDIRNCIVALSESEQTLKDLFQYRFDNGNDLKGMSLGNLFLAGMTKVTGDIHSAVKETSKILKIKGKVLPSISENTQICAEFENGEVLEEEFNVRTLGTSPIKRIFLKDDVHSEKEVINAINNADLIIIGPGSFYTSVLVHFLVPNLKEAVKNSKAKKIMFCNMITQAGQTNNYTLSKHIEEAERYIGNGVVDYYIVNNKSPGEEIMKNYEEEGGFLVEDDVDKAKEEFPHVKIIRHDLVKDAPKEQEWNKVASIRHDPAKSAKIAMKVLGREKVLKAVILAAGYGTRMRPFSFSRSKTMLRFLGKPLLEFHVKECEDAGIDEIVIVCSRTNKDEIREHFKNYGGKAKIAFVVQEEQLGPANAILAAEKYLKDSYFLLKYADSVSSGNETEKIISKFNENKDVDAVITLRKVEDTREYGIAKFKEIEGDKTLVEIVEKPERAPSEYANVGLGIMNGEKFFHAINDIGFEKVLVPQQYILMDGGTSSFWVTDSVRLDVGRAWNILEVNKLLIERFGVNQELREHKIPESAKIDSTVYIGEKAIISDDVEIKGYSSIEGYVGKGAKIKDSVVMENSKIGKNCIIESSVIGRNNMIGDNVVTEVDGEDIQIYVSGRYVNPSIKKAGIFTGDNVTIFDNVRCSPGKMIFPNKIVKEDLKDDRVVRAILFDADNTIYSTKDTAKPADMKAMEYFSEKTGISADELYEKWRTIVGNIKGEKDPEKRLRKYSYGLLAKELGFNGVNEGYTLFKEEVINRIKSMPNFSKIAPLLKDYKLALFTEDYKDLAGMKMSKFELDGLFDIAITSDQIGEMKPSRKYYEEVFRKFKVVPNECIVIGDSFENDLEIAKEMGATTVIFGSEDQRADYSIKDYAELPRILQEI